MIALHPKYLERNGEKEFAVLPIEEFEAIREELELYEELKILREAKMKEGDAPTVLIDTLLDSISSIH